MDSMFLFADILLHHQAVFRVAKKFHCGCRISLQKLLIIRDDLHQYIAKTHIRDHQYSNQKFSWPPYLWYMVSAMYSLPPSFGYPLFNVDSPQMNSLLFLKI